MFRSITHNPLSLVFIALLFLPTAAAATDLKVANAWASLPQSWENASAYFVIQNNSDKARTIVGASCEKCDYVEILRAVFKDGAMGSEKLEKMEIPAGGAGAFVPRGLSLNLVGLAALAAGEKLEVELEFKDGEKLVIEAVGREE